MTISLDVVRKTILSTMMLTGFALVANPAHANTVDSGAPIQGVFGYIQCNGHDYFGYTQNQANLPGVVEFKAVAYYGNGPRYDILLIGNPGRDSWLSWERAWDTAPSSFNGKAFHHIQGTHNYFPNSGGSFTYTSRC